MAFRHGFMIAAAVLAFTTGANAGVVTVTSSDGLFTNAGPSNASGPGANLDTWFANNVRSDGAAGITTRYPNNGNGSIEFDGSANRNSKADYEYYFSSPNQFLLSELNAFSYDYYRSSSSTANARYMPAMRLSVSDGTRAGYLVFEGTYNNQLTAQTDSFLSENIIGAKFWATGTLPDAFSNYDRTLADWVNLLPNLRVTALSTGIGSGWDGTFSGGVDNITYGRSGQEAISYNFEVAGGATAVPEPASLTLLGIGLAGLAAARRRRAG